MPILFTNSLKRKQKKGKNKDKRTGRSLFSIVRIKAKINNMNEWSIIDTGFSGLNHFSR
jgi:hypothetical protein